MAHATRDVKASTWTATTNPVPTTPARTSVRSLKLRTLLRNGALEDDVEAVVAGDRDPRCTEGTKERAPRRKPGEQTADPEQDRIEQREPEQPLEREDTEAAGFRHEPGEGVEVRVNREIGRRTDVVGIFPNDRSLIRLAASVVIEQNDKWLVGRRYLSAHSIEQVLEEDEETETKDQEVLALTAA